MCVLIGYFLFKKKGLLYVIGCSFFLQYERARVYVCVCLKFAYFRGDRGAERERETERECILSRTRHHCCCCFLYVKLKKKRLLGGHIVVCVCVCVGCHHNHIQEKKYDYQVVVACIILQKHSILYAHEFFNRYIYIYIYRGYLARRLHLLSLIHSAVRRERKEIKDMCILKRNK